MCVLQKMPRICFTLLMVLVYQQCDLVTSSEATPPDMETSVIRMNITEGRTAILPCMVKTITREISTKYQVQWLNPQNVAISYGTTSLSNDRRFSVLRPFPADWNLRISRVRGRDAGRYVCQLRTEPVQERVVYLYVQVPPSVESSGQVFITEGRNMQIFCNASGKPKPTLSWYKDGKVIPEIKSEILIVENISRQMAGNFSCLASNGVTPNVTKTIPVTVQFSPKVSLYSKRMGQYRHKEVILVCAVTENPVGQVTWYKEGRPLKDNWKYEIETMPGTNDQRYLRVKIRQMQREDFGEYTCEAQNSVGYDEATMVVYELTTSTVTPRDVITTPRAPYGTTRRGGIKKTHINTVNQARPDEEYTGKAGKHGLIVVTDGTTGNTISQSPPTLGLGLHSALVCVTVLLALHT